MGGLLVSKLARLAVVAGGELASRQATPPAAAILLEPHRIKSADLPSGSPKARRKWAKPGMTNAEKAEVTRVRRGRNYAYLKQSLRSAGYSKHANNLVDCGRLLVYACGSCEGQAARRVYRCRFKMCPYCLAERSNAVGDKLADLIATWRNPVMLTLTLRNGHNLQDRDKIIRSSFDRLRRRKLFTLSGGVTFWETTYNPVSGWHVHLHILADGWIDVFLLSALWKKSTRGEGEIVYVTALSSEKAAIKEACKYPVKLGDICRDPELVTEFLEGTHGRRHWWAWGDAYKHQAELEKAEESGSDDDQVSCKDACPHCGVVGDMLPVFDGLYNRTWLITTLFPTRGGWWLSAPPGG